MGTRSQRFAMLVDNGVVKQLNVEKPGAFEVSSAETMMKQIASGPAHAIADGKGRAVPPFLSRGWGMRC